MSGTISTVSTYYTITMTNPGGTTAPADGFVDPTKVEQYMTLPEGVITQGTGPSDTGYSDQAGTYANQQSKKRANIRWAQVIAQLQQMACCYVSPDGRGNGTPIAYTGTPTATSEPSSVTFTITVDQGDGVLFAYDELNGNAPLTGTAAIQRWVARGLMYAQTDPNAIAPVFDPTPQPVLSGFSNNDLPRVTYRVATLAVAPPFSTLANASAAVTVVSSATS